MTNGPSSPCSSLPPASPLELSDIQGLVLRGYNYRYVRHLIFHISSDEKAVAGVQEFCRDLVPGSGAAFNVTTAENWGTTPPPYCLNIGFTPFGLQKVLGPNYSTVATGQLFAVYPQGAADPTRANYVGDTGPSAPENWWKYGGWKLKSEPNATELDFLISFYALDADSRESLSNDLVAMIPNGSDGLPVAVPAFVMDSDPLLDTAGQPTSNIHFGYRDGISQPRIQGTPWDDPGTPGDDLPCVPSYYFVVSDADAAPYNAHPLLLNGGFGAFRLLYQDVGAFEDFIGQTGSPDLIAAKMCGRWFDGTPLEVSPGGPDPNLSDVDLSNFNYINPTPHQKGPRENDDSGQICPYAAHTRRSNPRDDTSVHFNSDNAMIRRIRRFATPFGPEYGPGTEDAYRGLIGLFMGVDLFNQFEFLMHTWIGQPGSRSPDTSPNHSGIDPVFGPQPAPPDPGKNADFDYLPDTSPFYETVPGLTRFIRTDGGLYLFIPGIKGLGYIGTGTLPPNN
jgi:hypothetical protein